MYQWRSKNIILRAGQVNSRNQQNHGRVKRKLFGKSFRVLDINFSESEATKF